MGFKFPPSFNNNSQGVVDNKKAKKVTFTRSNGRISLKMGGKDIAGERLLSNRIKEMESEIRQSQAGSVVTTAKDFGPGGPEFQRHGIKSTFPKWFGQLGFNSKKDFLQVLNRKKGIKHDRLVNRAIEDLSEGHDSSFGRVPASEEFQIKTRQKFDNRGVSFRFINGKVRPIRGGVPF